MLDTESSCSPCQSPTTAPIPSTPYAELFGNERCYEAQVQPAPDEDSLTAAFTAGTYPTPGDCWEQCSLYFLPPPATYFSWSDASKRWWCSGAECTRHYEQDAFTYQILVASSPFPSSLPTTFPTALPFTPPPSQWPSYDCAYRSTIIWYGLTYVLRKQEDTQANTCIWREEKIVDR